MGLIIFKHFEKKNLQWGVQTLTTTNFEHFSLGGVETLTIKIQKLKFFGYVGGPLKVKFANPFIIYQS